jgi:Flp pilus assembly protein TadG
VKFGLIRRTAGQSLVELGIAVPILLLCAGVAVDFGRAYYFDLSLRDAAFAAARYGGMHPNDDSGIRSAAVTAAPSGTLDDSAVTVSGSPPRGTGSRLTVSVTYRFRPLTPVISSLTGSSIVLSRQETDIVK